MRVILTIVLCLFCAGLFASQVPVTGMPVQVEENTAPATTDKPRIDIGAGYWYTWGTLDTELLATEDDSFGGIYYKRGDKVSELNYDTDAGLFVIDANAYLFWRIYADAFVGIGDMRGDSEQIDSDWLWQYSTSKWYESKASADGDVTTWNANAYFRIIQEPNNKGFLDVSAGYFYNRDDITKMSNLVYYIENYENVVDPIPGLDSSDKYTFDGARFGLRAQIQLIDRLAVKGCAGFVPWMHADRSGYWNLRDMKIEGNADGTSFDVGIGLEFKITKNLFIEAGYKYIDSDTDRGDYSHTIDGVKYEYKDGWGSTESRRGGVYAMGRLKF